MVKSVMGGARRSLRGGIGDESANYQFNAGAQFVKMTMVIVAPSTYDVVYSKAVHLPALSFNPIVQGASLREIYIQTSFDDAVDVKVAVFDDLVFWTCSYV
ncbi:unnamed protein product [Prorocentrum cordatum]|uniref:Uncharacterized protein n=1 Tax=Prorocentrum cordatum TaxID=2364126 RepID=A0ABN9VTS8_9DINO|nr:unnamed protein product [Polarella glacialis]